VYEPDLSRFEVFLPHTNVSNWQKPMKKTTQMICISSTFIRFVSIALVVPVIMPLAGLSREGDASYGLEPSDAKQRPLVTSPGLLEIDSRGEETCERQEERTCTASRLTSRISARVKGG